MSKRPKQNFEGFTLIELLIALIVTSIVLTAVATLAYALGAANDATDDRVEKQAQVRYITLRISELIRHCKLICDVQSDELAVWKSDDDGDGEIDIRELVYVETKPLNKSIQFAEFLPPPMHEDRVVQLSEIRDHTIRPWLTGNCDTIYTVWIQECNNVQFHLDDVPPQTKLVGISFDLLENGIERNYQMNTALRSWAGNLLSSNDSSAEIVAGDDD
jgi:prepilin-type N-terminal cleavage/methylation domain-containing protein